MSLPSLSLPFIASSRSRADDSVAFSHQTYAEEHGRMEVQTETLRIQKTITPWLDVTIREIYDGISGATPTGAPPIGRLHMRDPFTGIGKPEPLKHLSAGAWSRRLTQEHRIVYLVSETRIDFLQARYHY
jgi:hypothetical protein